MCLHDFDAPTEKQILGFASELGQRGHEVMISLGGDAATAEREGAAELPHIRIVEHRFVGRRLRVSDEAAATAFAPTLIHASLSRLPVVAAAARFRRATGAPVFVHFGDDEWNVAAGVPGEPLYRPFGRLGRRVAARLQPSVWQYSTRASLRWVQRHALALDALTPALANEVTARTGRECSVLLPVMPPAERLSPTPNRAAAAPSLPEDGPIALFAGLILPVYAGDVLLGMRAVAEVQRRGHPVRFVQVGNVHPRLDAGAMALEAGLRPGSALFLGYVPMTAVPPLLGRADILLQPGAPTDFNRLRLPAKLQAYLASGTPTITFAAGFGELLRDRREVLKTYSSEPAELADRMVELLTDDALRTTLRTGGPAAAERLFDPATNAEALLEHYRACLQVVGS